ncbi:MAG: class I fructose-bisphosphate aldolase [Steroidobacter sp.]
MNADAALHEVISMLVRRGKGILAADESQSTIANRFKAVGVESTEENRRAYRALLLTAPRVEEFISGVILFEETLDQATDDGIRLPQAIQRRGIVPGVKVDKGTIALSGAAGDVVTQGLDGLGERLKLYKSKGARFAKWREVYLITDDNPTPLGLEVNAEVLARYAAICQEQGIVPIVEPEVLYDGNHTLQRCAHVTEAVLQSVFHALIRHRIKLELLLLKPSMVLPGKNCPVNMDANEVARETITTLRRSVPAAVPSIHFLSGGQTPQQAAANLNAMNVLFAHPPWNLSFSFARALQQPVLELWRGKHENTAAAQRLFYLRAKIAGAACEGLYQPEMEADARQM